MPVHPHPSFGDGSPDTHTAHDSRIPAERPPPDQLKAAADAWCWLLDLPATDEDARDEAMSDAPLLVALVVLPASE